ncbi:type II pantothenate kinase [Acrasis kona]|uniref:pantothenate kinase n=1 Tax=Acrasis kona TaxID=1008807 RepID=A0AAW2YX67_9EUKA
MSDTDPQVEGSKLPNGLNLKGVVHVQLSPSENVVFQRKNDNESGTHVGVLGATENHFILLPNHNDPVNYFALDIGGSLIKMVYLVKNESNETVLRFARFKTADIHECISFMQRKRSIFYETVHVTGGGAYKFASLLEDKLSTKITKFDEMQCLIKGLNFFLKNLIDESFSFQNDQKIFEKSSPSESTYPYLLVNIGSGVSILKVNGDDDFDRVSGSSMGGGTFWGLSKLLTGISSFEEVLELSSQGDNKQVDMLVGDIYGQGRDYKKIGLSTDVIASSFGKTIMSKTGEETPKMEKADMLKSLLYLVCNNIAQIAYLNAVRYNLKRIYFAGYFIRDHPTTMRSLSYAVNFWSAGQIKAMFLKHEGYLGSMGAFIEQKTPEQEE